MSAPHFLAQMPASCSATASVSGNLDITKEQKRGFEGPHAHPPRPRRSSREGAVTHYARSPGLEFSCKPEQAPPGGMMIIRTFLYKDEESDPEPGDRFA